MDWTAADDELSRVETSGVPFLLRLPSQKAEVPYEREFNTVVCRRLITAILSGRVTSAEQVAKEIELE